MPRLDGIDVSKHQGDIDWTSVAADIPDVRFVMARMTHGGHGDDDLRIDRRGRANQIGMRREFPRTARGYYAFLGTSDPAVQARHFRSQVGDLEPGEFVMLDVEVDPPARVGEQPVPHIVATLEAIEAEFGVTPWLYIPQPGTYTDSDDVRLHRFPLMLPIYADEPTFRRFADRMGRPTLVWQWGGGGRGARVAGIDAGRVDSNEIMDATRFVATLVPGLIDVERRVDELVVSSDEPLGFMPELSQGDRGNAVILLQTLLIAHGTFKDRPRNRDGAFEDGTRRGVERFQSTHDLPVTGRVDHSTWARLAASPR